MVLREIHLAVLEAKDYPKDSTEKINNDLLSVKTRFKAYSEQAGLQVSVDTQIPNSKVSIEMVSRHTHSPPPPYSLPQKTTKPLYKDLL